MKQTFEILPLQGVYWKDKDLKLTFGMSLNQFDEYFPDSNKSTKWDCQCRYIKLPVMGKLL